MALTDELKASIGTIIEPVIMEIERGAIRRYAAAIDDPDPLFHDVEYARSSRYGEMICPPGFFGWPIKGAELIEELGSLAPALARAGFPRILDGGVDFEFYLPVRAGDILTSYGKIADIRERTGRTGTMIFSVFETTFINQNGDLVAKRRATIISR
ncbi:MAG: MaoC family dehydratase N-terminal domain-containing protein [Dehalococcoidia bacterium]